MAIVNKVQTSGIQVYDLESLWDGASLTELDLAPFLKFGQVLIEREFRRKVADFDWSPFGGTHVAIYCSTDAIVPTWAYLLLTARLDSARSVTFGRQADAVAAYFERALQREDWDRFDDRIVVIKGCGTGLVPSGAYVTAMRHLTSVARKVMYGEPCSNVPLWRKKR